jgi:hypothetical protein
MDNQETFGRVIVFVNAEPTDPEQVPVEVFAIPADWDADDIERFVKSNEDAWVTAAVVAVKEPVL